MPAIPDTTPVTLSPVTETAVTAPTEPVQTAPVVEATPAPAPVATPVETAPSAPEPISEIPEAPSLLNSEVKPATPVVEEVKPVEEAPETKPTELAPQEVDKTTDEEPKPTDDQGGQTEDPAPPPSFEPFVVPEGVQLDNDKVSEFTNILSELELNGKVDHALVQAFGQKAVDFHVNELKQTVENLNKLYQLNWEKTQNDWKESFLKDPELGGARANTTLDAANRFIRTHGGTPEQQKEFRELMNKSGLGNHPTMIRILANAARNLREGQPLQAPKPAPAPKSKTATLYGKS